MLKTEFTPQQQERLTTFLAAPARPEGTLRYEAVAGFLFAVACSPKQLTHQEWLPLIFNGKEPGYASAQEKEEVEAALMALYNLINVGLIEGRAVLPPGVEARAGLDNLAEDAPLRGWSAGFAKGHEHVLGRWNQYVPGQLGEKLGMFVTVLGYFGSHPGAEITPKEMIKDQRALEEYVDSVLVLFPEATKVYARIAAIIQMAVGEGKLGSKAPRYDNRLDDDAPCPCGSGKKYRECCGVDGPILH